MKTGAKPVAPVAAIAVLMRAEAIEAAIKQLAIVMGTKPGPTIGRATCNAVAELIAGVQHSSTEQQNLMDYAVSQGFQPEYYVNSIRVHWNSL